MISDTTKGMLAQDITTPERWEEVRSAMRMEGYIPREVYLQPPFDSLTNGEWYYRREVARMEHVYTTTDVLDRINRCMPGYFIHVKVGHEDVQMVAYTSSAEDAKRDKKHLIRLGRLLSKLFPLFTDKHIADLCVQHAEEADPSIEINFGWEALHSAYKAIGSCMSKDASVYSALDDKGNNHFPIEVYDMPHIGIAVTRDAEGNINGRALVIPDKKVYIRAYGNPVLLKKLTRNGYKPGSWVGTELKLVELSREEATINGKKYDRLKVVLPYLDANGSTATTAHCTVAIIDGKLRGISTDQSRRIQAVFPGASYTFAVASNTAGFGHLISLKSEDICIRDGITGEVVADENELITVYYQGSIVSTKTKSWYSVVDGPVLTARCVTGKGNTISLEAMEKDTIIYDGRRFTTNKETLDYFDLGVLDERYYPAGGYIRTRSNIYRELSNGKYIKTKDSRTVIRNVGETISRDFEHNSEATKGRKLVKVHRLHGEPEVYAAEGVEILKTDTGRKVVRGIHNISTLWDGTVTLSTGVKYASILGTDVLYKGDMPAELQVGGSFWMKEFNSKVEHSFSSANRYPLEALLDIVERMDSFHVRNEYAASWALPMTNTMFSILRTHNVDPQHRNLLIAHRLYAEELFVSIRDSGWGTRAGAVCEKVISALRDAFIEAYYREAEARAVDFNIVDTTLVDAMLTSNVETAVQEQTIELEVIG